MVVVHARCVKSAELFVGQKSQGSAESEFKLPSHSCVYGDDLLEIFIGWASSGGHDSKSGYTLCLISLRSGYDPVGIKKGIGFAGGMMVGGLGAKPAIFTAASALAVDDRAKVHPVPAEMLSQPVSRSSQCFKVTVDKKAEIILGAETTAGNDLIGKGY